MFLCVHMYINIHIYIYHVFLIFFLIMPDEEHTLYKNCKHFTENVIWCIFRFMYAHKYFNRNTPT